MAVLLPWVSAVVPVVTSPLVGFELLSLSDQFLWTVCLSADWAAAATRVCGLLLYSGRGLGVAPVPAFGGGFDMPKRQQVYAYVLG